MNSHSHSLVVVDYGSGNLRSVWQAARRAAADTDWQVRLSNRPEDIVAANRLILPGQGAMRDCMDGLRTSGLLEPVLHAARTKPLFGVCVGMQMLLTHSEEGDTPALGLIDGEVVRFNLDGQRQPDGSRYKVPQMGWNTVHRPPDQPTHPLWDGIDDGSWFYFVHSYYARPRTPLHCAGITHFGVPFASVLARDNLFATQFHPEKSAAPGIALYRNFLRWNP